MNESLYLPNGVEHGPFTPLTDEEIAVILDSNQCEFDGHTLLQERRQYYGQLVAIEDAKAAKLITNDTYHWLCDNILWNSGQRIMYEEREARQKAIEQLNATQMRQRSHLNTRSDYRAVLDSMLELKD